MASKSSIDEVLRPIREGFASCTPEELDVLFREAREEAWQLRQKAEDVQAAAKAGYDKAQAGK